MAWRRPPPREEGRARTVTRQFYPKMRHGFVQSFVTTAVETMKSQTVDGQNNRTPTQWAAIDLPPLPPDIQCCQCPFLLSECSIILSIRPVVLKTNNIEYQGGGGGQRVGLKIVRLFCQPTVALASVVGDLAAQRGSSIRIRGLGQSSSRAYV